MLFGLLERLTDGTQKKTLLSSLLDGHQSKTITMSSEKSTEDNPIRTSENSAQFMIAEFESLYSQRHALNTLTNSEINIYFAIVTASAVAVGFLSGFFAESRISFLWSTIGLVCVLLILGLFILYRTINSRIQNVVYVRAMNLVRRYFVDHDPHLKIYLRLPVTDDSPRFSSIGQDSGFLASILTNTGILSVVNAGLSIVLWLGVHSILYETGTIHRTQDWIIAFVSLVIFAVVLWGQVSMQSYMLQEAESNQPVHFPSETHNQTDKTL
ncbi:MAG: hypothetical protein ACR2OU_13530 [Thermomicrobiales bacterium]